MCDELVASCCPHPGAQLSLCQAVAKLPGLSSCAWLAGVITSSQPGLTVSHNPSSLVPIPGRHSLLREELESGGPFQNCNDSLRRGEQAGNDECRPVRVSRTPSLGLTSHWSGFSASNWDTLSSSDWLSRVARGSRVTDDMMFQSYSQCVRWRPSDAPSC